MLRVKKYMAIAAAIIVLAVGGALALENRPDTPGPNSSSKELVEAARRAYELRLKAFMTSEASVLDETYLWSKRWMTAEWDFSTNTRGVGKGARTHYERMVELEKIVKRMHEAGQGSEFDVAAARYYRVEAEIMLARSGE